MWKAFKEFAVKGNAIDLAVGVIIGAAFGKIVTSVVEDLLMPPLGKVLGNLNFADYYIPLSEKITPETSLDAARKAGLPVFAYGNFITVMINFLIVAFCIFLVVKAINRLKRPARRPRLWRKIAQPARCRSRSRRRVVRIARVISAASAPKVDRAVLPRY